MNDLKTLWSFLSPESDFWLLTILWAIAFYLFFGNWHWQWSQKLMGVFDLAPQADDEQSLSFWQGLILVFSLFPFLCFGVTGHLFFLWGFGHIWSVSLAVLGCICGGIYELISQNETLG